jgi:hypothetical protein
VARSNGSPFGAAVYPMAAGRILRIFASRPKLHIGNRRSRNIKLEALFPILPIFFQSQTLPVSLKKKKGRYPLGDIVKPFDLQNKQFTALKTSHHSPLHHFRPASSLLFKSHLRPNERQRFQP